MKNILSLQTEYLTNIELEDLIQYSVQLKGKALICQHDIINRNISLKFVLVYCCGEYELLTYESFADLCKNGKLTTVKDKYDFFKLLNSSFKYE